MVPLERVPRWQEKRSSRYIAIAATFVGSAGLVVTAFVLGLVGAGDEDILATAAASASLATGVASTPSAGAAATSTGTGTIPEACSRFDVDLTSHDIPFPLRLDDQSRPYRMTFAMDAPADVAGVSLSFGSWDDEQVATSKILARHPNASVGAGAFWGNASAFTPPAGASSLLPAGRTEITVEVRSRTQEEYADQYRQRGWRWGDFASPPYVIEGIGVVNVTFAYEGVTYRLARRYSPRAEVTCTVVQE